MIVRGTTPRLEFGIPFEADSIATGFMVVKQNDVTVIEKELSSCECDGRTVSAKLTQEETLSLSKEWNAEINLVVRTIDGDRFESETVYERVGDTSKDGVI